MSLTSRKVLVTGSAGFIGSHLVERLVADGASVVAMVRYNSRSARGWLDTSPVVDDLDVRFGDVRDPEFVDACVAGCDTVFHLAALIGIPYSYVAPREYVRTNIEGTLNVLNAARRHGTRRVVHTSTSEVYGTAQYVPIDEAHPLQGQSPYSASKIGADTLAESFYRSFETPVVTARPFNTFGPRQSTRAVVPTIILQALEREWVELGTLSPTRDLNFVSDTVAGFVCCAMAEGAEGQTFNLGSGGEISIGDLASKICALLGVEREVRSSEARVRPAGSEVERLVAESAKAASTLGWSSEVSLDDGLAQTIAWLRANRAAYRADEYGV